MAASFTFAEFRRYMDVDMKEVVAEAVIGVADKVKVNTQNIENLASKVADIKEAVAPKNLKTSLVSVLAELNEGTNIAPLNRKLQSASTGRTTRTGVRMEIPSYLSTTFKMIERDTVTHYERDMDRTLSATSSLMMKSSHYS